ncbi:hypothetical protein Cni_G18496 [Canna indica]|uniref:Uncharacterized protein n=1 Tax=Canna indica TaxID=4628 RepID=A0AAQ3KMC8_9LILI|nr:hypothetical protein Cni_G18496 [Canna indica]
MDRRPPLAVSPRRLRPRRPPPGAYALSSHAPTATSKKRPPSNRSSAPVVESLARPQHQLVSSELSSPVERAKEDLGGFSDVVASAAVALSSPGAGNKSPLFERGRFYDLYSARRNERLKRKQAEISGDEMALAQDPNVAVELAKRRLSKKTESARKSMPADFSASRASSLRSPMRSSKEMKKAYTSVAAASECSAGAVRRTSTRSVRRL